MEQSTLLPISLGSLIKKITDINPNLNPAQVIQIVKEATGTTGKSIDEGKAIQLARCTLGPGTTRTC